MSNLIRKELEKIVILTLREIFKHHPDFKYDDDDTITKILITPRYAMTDTDSKPPQILISGITYSVSRQTMYNNYAGSLHDTKGVVIGEAHSVPFNFNLDINVLSTVDGESDNLSDILVNIFDHDYAGVFEAQGLNFLQISSGPPTITRPYPQYEFVTGVQISGEAVMDWTIAHVDAKLLRNIRVQYSTYD